MKSPKNGKLPTLTYEHNEDEKLHNVKCACGESCSVTDPMIARRFAQSHVGVHARARIFTPIPDTDL